MKFGFNLQETFDGDSDGFIRFSKEMRTAVRPTGKREHDRKACILIDEIGKESCKAQGLNHAITSFDRFLSSDHRLYIKVENDALIGYIKVGEKDLFYYTRNGEIIKLAPLCVLDFYVCESRQRSGLGKKIFDRMLEYEKCEASKLAYDRPSTKFVSFLRKHYNLSNYIPQSNNFIIFDKFFTSNPSKVSDRHSTMSSDKSDDLEKSEKSTKHQKSEKAVLCNVPLKLLSAMNAYQGPVAPFYTGSPRQKEGRKNGMATTNMTYGCFLNQNYATN